MRLKKNNPTFWAIPLLLWLIFVVTPGLTAAETSGSDNDPMAGFDEPEAIETKAAPKASWIQWGGFMRMDAGYNLKSDPPPIGMPDHRGLSRLRATLNLETKLRLGEKWRAKISGQGQHDLVFGLRGREYYAPTVTEARENLAEWQEIYLSGPVGGGMELKLGRQIVAWGTGDMVRVVDVMNPLNLAEPGFSDLEEIRRPVTMTRMDLPLAGWSMTALAVHEIRFHLIPPPGGEFLAFPPAPPPPEEVPTHGGKNMEYGLSLTRSFSGLDLGFYWASVFADMPHGGISPTTGTPALIHDRISMGGLSFSLTSGSWLWKGEWARVSGITTFSLPGEVLTRQETMLGTEYSGFSDTTLALEWGYGRFQAFQPALALPPDNLSEESAQWAASYRRSFLRQKLNLAWVFAGYGKKGEAGSLTRYEAKYELVQATHLKMGWITYTPGDGSNPMLASAGDNDQAFINLRRDF